MKYLNNIADNQFLTLTKKKKNAKFLLVDAVEVICIIYWFVIMTQNLNCGRVLKAT